MTETFHTPYEIERMRLWCRMYLESWSNFTEETTAAAADKAVAEFDKRFGPKVKDNNG